MRFLEGLSLLLIGLQLTGYIAWAVPWLLVPIALQFTLDFCVGYVMGLLRVQAINKLIKAQKEQ
jgi:hypothetical protein